MSPSETSFNIHVDTNIYTSVLPLPTSLFQVHTPSSSIPEPQSSHQNSSSLGIASPSPRRSVVAEWEPYPCPINPMRHNLDITESRQDSLNSQNPSSVVYRVESPAPAPVYSPSSLPSYNPRPSSPYPPFDYEAYTEEYGDTHPAYALRCVWGMVTPDSPSWEAWANAGSELLRVMPGWSMLMRDDYGVFVHHVFEFDN
jgi:hypothetical protein